MSHSSEEKYLPRTVPNNAHQVLEWSDEQLLDAYLSMPKKLRDTQFVDTASAAEMAGISQRTIELWIEAGSLRAVTIGKKYKVSVQSLIVYLKEQASKRTT